MFRKIIGTIVGGVVGLGALYLVAKVAYAEGYEAAQETAAPDEKIPREENPKKVGKLGLLMGLRKMGRSKKTILSDLANNPEDYKLEAYISGGEAHLTISKKQIFSREKNKPFSG
jgi:hypothetical protein